MVIRTVKHFLGVVFAKTTFTSMESLCQPFVQSHVRFACNWIITFKIIQCLVVFWQVICVKMWRPHPQRLQDRQRQPVLTRARTVRMLPDKAFAKAITMWAKKQSWSIVLFLVATVIRLVVLHGSRVWIHSRSSVRVLPRWTYVELCPIRIFVKNHVVTAR